MGILQGNGSLPGNGDGGNKCDYCGAKIYDSSSAPHIGNSALMRHNRYFCSNTCLENWRNRHNY